ncbi:MAG TPA: hypothetical protein VHR66_11275 [Gemmataceae bacterium]|jgi:hypothetical protein|nr:hypothetical protein [Gemmataceae bacterium]
MVLPSVDVANEGAINIGDMTEDDDSVQLAAMPEPPSGQSLTSWTEVIRRQRAAQIKEEGSERVKVDALSDRDLLTRLEDDQRPGGAAAVTPRRPGDTSPIPQAELPIFTAPPLPSGRSESDIDLGLGAQRTGTGESEVKFDILYPPSDAGGVMPAPGMAPLSSVDFRAATPVKLPSESDIPFAAMVEAGASGVNLGSADAGGPIEGGRSSILDVLLKDSTSESSASSELLDFGSEPPVRTTKPTHPAAERPVVPTRPAIEVGDGPPDDLELMETDRGSEDAIDLYADAAVAPSITDSGTLEISEKAMADAQRRAEEQESSSIDLNSRPSFAGEEFDAALEAKSNASIRSDSDIDLNLPAVEDPGNSSLVRGQSNLDENSAILAQEFETRRKERAASDSNRRPRKRGDVVPARDDEAPVRSGGYLIHGGIIGLLLGAGGVLAAYFGGALPNRQPENKPVVADNSAELARLKQDAEVARIAADQMKTSLERQVADAKLASAGEITQLKADAERARADAQKASDAATEANTKLATATKTATDATKELGDAKKAVETAQTEAVAAKKASEEAAANFAKTFKDAGLDPAKPVEAIKSLADAKTAAEVKAKEADAKVTEATKKLEDMTVAANTAKKEADEARKNAADLAKARDASDAMMKAVVDRLAKAKFVGDKTDSAAILKGIDDAVKAGSTDATATLRDELVKIRDQEAKAKAALAVATEKEIASAKAAENAKADAQKAVAEAAKGKAENSKLSQDLASATLKAIDAEKLAQEAKNVAERTSAEVARLKVENDRLTRDLDTVKELADLIKQSPAMTTSPLSKPDPARLAEQSFGEGLRSFHAGRSTDAESAFRKAVLFSPSDARFHYFLGLTLWARKDTAGAEAEFVKGHDLEMASRPTSKMIGAALERIQGPARQIVDSYRP